MSITHLPAMLVSESTGWNEISRRHPSARQLFFCLVAPLSLIPPALYAYAERVHPGVVFPLSAPALTGRQLLVTGLVFYLAQLAMVSFMAMVVQRLALARDHDPGFESAYALAAIAPVPLWLAPLALFVPSLSLNAGVIALAWLATAALIRHGVRPLLKVDDADRAHYIANLVTAAGIAAWVGLMIAAAAILSIMLSWWSI